MIKLAVISLALLIGAQQELIREVKLERMDSLKVLPGAELTFKGSVAFTHEACDQAPKNTAFYVKGAEIIERGEWQRIDENSLFSVVKVRIIDPSEALVTMELVKHTDKKTDQIKLTVVH